MQENGVTNHILDGSVHLSLSDNAGNLEQLRQTDSLDTQTAGRDGCCFLGGGKLCGLECNFGNHPVNSILAASDRSRCWL